MATWVLEVLRRSTGGQASLSSPRPSLETPCPPAKRRGARRPLLHFLCTRSRAPAPLVPLPGGSIALSGLSAHPKPARAVHSPSAVQTTSPPVQRAGSPRIPLSTLLRAPSLARCPLLALELAVTGTAVRLLQAPGLPPRLRAVARPGLHHHRDRCSSPPRSRRLLSSRTHSGHFSPLHYSPGPPEEVGTDISPDREACTLSREAQPRGPLPCPRCAPLGARLGAA